MAWYFLGVSADSSSFSRKSAHRHQSTGSRSVCQTHCLIFVWVRKRLIPLKCLLCALWKGSTCEDTSGSCSSSTFSLQVIFYSGSRAGSCSAHRKLIQRKSSRPTRRSVRSLTEAIYSCCEIWGVNWQGCVTSRGLCQGTFPDWLDLFRSTFLFPRTWRQQWSFISSGESNWITAEKLGLCFV